MPSLGWSANYANEVTSMQTIIKKLIINKIEICEDENLLDFVYKLLFSEG